MLNRQTLARPCNWLYSVNTTVVLRSHCLLLTVLGYHLWLKGFYHRAYRKYIFTQKISTIVRQTEHEEDLTGCGDSSSKKKQWHCCEKQTKCGFVWEKADSSEKHRSRRMGEQNRPPYVRIVHHAQGLWHSEKHRNEGKGFTCSLCFLSLFLCANSLLVNINELQFPPNVF